MGYFIFYKQDDLNLNLKFTSHRIENEGFFNKPIELKLGKKR